MKSRADAMKERAAKAGKPSAEERTQPLPNTTAPAGKTPKKVFDCKPCGETCVVEECTIRSNGHIECKECGAPHHPDDVRDAGDVPPLEPKKPAAKTTSELAKETEAKEEKREAEKAARLPTPPTMFCKACTKPLTWAPGVATYFYSCGHNKDEHGMTPDETAAKASRSVFLAAAAAAMTSAPIEVRRPEPESTVPMVRLNVQWGKARCPVDRFNAFEVGAFSISVDIPVTEDRVAIGKQLLSDLEQLAEESFNRQKAWYEKKLGILGVGDD